MHVLGNRHWGETAVALSGRTSGLMGLGDRVTWRARHFLIRQRLTSEITAFHAPDYFEDTMVSGAFRSMRHEHFFVRRLGGETEMRDVFCFAAPLAVLGWLAEQLVLRRYMQRLLRERNAVIRQVAESEDWRRYVDANRDSGR